METLPLRRLNTYPAFRPLPASSSFSEADSEAVEDKIDRLTAILQKFINLEASAEDDWTDLKAELLEPSCGTDRSQVCGRSLNDFSASHFDKDCEHDEVLMTLNRALMEIEDLRSQEQPAYVEFTVEEAELAFFIEQLKEVAEGLRGERQQTLLYFGGRHLKLTVNGLSFANHGRRLSQQLAVGETAELAVKMRKAFCRDPSQQVSAADASCLDEVYGTLESLRVKLSGQLQEAKSIADSFARHSRPETPKDTQEECLSFQLDNSSSSYSSSRLTERRTALNFNRHNPIQRTQEQLLLELKNLELNYPKSKTDIIKAARIATRISRIKTELQRLRTAEAIKASKENIRLQSKVCANLPSNAKVNRTFDQVLMRLSTDICDESFGTPSQKQTSPSFLIDSFEGSSSTPYKPNRPTLPLQDLYIEQSRLQNRNLKYLNQLKAQSKTLANEWVKLEAERKHFKKSKQLFERKKAIAAKEVQVAKIERVCRSFLKKLDRLKL